MRLLPASLLLLASACAAHNSHRVPIDLNADLAMLIDEAWGNMETAWNEPVPIGSVPVAVAVERVEVQWLPFDPEVPPGGEVVPQAELVGRIQEALRAAPPPEGPHPGRRVRVGLATDLHEPDALQIQVQCELLEGSEPARVLAHGLSSIVRFERLYCHGCRERWSGHGTRLGIGGDGHGALFVEGGALFYFPGSSPGYIKH